MQIHGDTIRFGIHSGQQYSTFEECLELWQRSEALGYDWISIFDHFRPMDRPTGPCFEGTTLLAAMAAHTSSVRCAPLVLGATYRHPAIVAALATTIDHISGARLELGLGAGAPDHGYEQYGLPFPSLGERLDMLNEACHILRSLWTRETTTFDGKYFHLKDARLEPKPLQKHLPLVIGGAGERRTLRIVAEHGDVWNTMAFELDQYRHKLGMLAGHCADVGRAVTDIRKSILFRAILAEDEREAEQRLENLIGKVPRDSPERRAWSVVGTPDQCIEHLQPYLDLGVSDFLLGVRPPIDWQTVELVARRVAPALRGG